MVTIARMRKLEKYKGVDVQIDLAFFWNLAILGGSTANLQPNYAPEASVTDSESLILV